MPDHNTKSTTTPQPHEQHAIIPSLRVVGGPLYRPIRAPEHELTLDYTRATIIGRHEDCDWMLPDATVSRFAVTVTRSTLGRIHVAKHSHASREPKRNNLPCGPSDFGPGDVFSLGDVYVMVYNLLMRRARARLAWWLGDVADRKRSVALVDDLLAAVTQGLPILLLGEASMWPGRLARFLHEDVSPRGQGPLVEWRGGRLGDDERAAFVDRCASGSALIALPDNPSSRDRMDIHALVAQLLDHGVPVFVTATHLDIARPVLKDLRLKFRETTIRPLKERRREMEAMIVGMALWLRLPVRAHAFVPNLPAMEAYTWPDNLDELAEVARNLSVMATRSVNETADHLRIARTTFKDWLKRYRFVATKTPGLSRQVTEPAANDNAEDTPTLTGGPGETLGSEDE